jgi:pilus assembly protein CpaF
MRDAIFSQIDFGPLKEFLEDDNVTDVSYTNGGQIWIKTLDKGVYKVERPEINDPLIDKLAFQCANTMGKTFNMAHPFLDAESAELRMNFVHDSIATNGIALVIRKTPAKIRLNKDKLLTEKYVTEELHNFLIKCVLGHCNIIVSGETGSGKTELVKYLASNTLENEKIVTIEDTLELHLDKIFPGRDIVAMKTNNIASYSDVLVTCMRQNPRWILLSEVRSAEAVMAVRNSISSGHNLISTIHSDSAKNIPMRMYSLLEGDQDIEQYLTSIHRYVQIGVHVKGYLSQELGRFQREIVEVVEFYVDDNNVAQCNILFKKGLDGTVTFNNPTDYLRRYMGSQGMILEEDPFHLGEAGTKTEKPEDKAEEKVENNTLKEESKPAEPASDPKPVVSTPTPAPAQPAAPQPTVATPKPVIAAQPTNPTVQQAPVVNPVTPQPVPTPSQVTQNTTSDTTTGSSATPMPTPVINPTVVA